MPPDSPSCSSSTKPTGSRPPAWSRSATTTTGTRWACSSSACPASKSARYPQLYSRIGFAHEYRPLTADELTVVLTRRWHADALGVDRDEFTETVAIATIARITGGNFRLVDRLLTQIQRIREINQLDNVTQEVVEAAREALLIGN